jgi:hypothetical protein
VSTLDDLAEFDGWTLERARTVISDVLPGASDLLTKVLDTDHLKAAAVIAGKDRSHFSSLSGMLKARLSEESFKNWKKQATEWEFRFRNLPKPVNTTPQMQPPPLLLQRYHSGHRS